MRSALLAAMVAAAFAPAAPAHAATQQCGGISPVEQRCSFTGTLALQHTLDILLAPEFTGRIHVEIVSRFGRYDADCTKTPATPRECALSQSGTLIPGETYTLTASTALAYRVGSLPEPASAGRWRVSLS